MKLILIAAFVLCAFSQDCDVLQFRLRSVKFAKKCHSSKGGATVLAMCKAGDPSQAWELKELNGGYQLAQKDMCIQSSGKIAKCSGANDVFTMNVNNGAPETKIVSASNADKCLGAPQNNGVSLPCGAANVWNNKGILWWVEPLF